MIKTLEVSDLSKALDNYVNIIISLFTKDKINLEKLI